MLAAGAMAQITRRDCRVVRMLKSIPVWLVIGAFAGWLANLIVKGSGRGLIGNIVVGIVGAVIAG
jgi:F0F1-type ATP synthase assembly protein I